MKFRIKICGVTNIADAQAAVDEGADAIGLNFYSKSPRYIDPAAAQAVSKALTKWASPDLIRIGVVVNEKAEWINILLKAVGLDAIQLHGDEPPEFLSGIETTQIIRARRFTDQGIGLISQDLEACDKAGRIPASILIDAATPGRYGGTGTTVSWSGLADYRRWLHNVPLILAGGLTPENVAEAIRIVRPQAVDVASGVESSPGKKDHAKVRDFVAAARDAFAQIEGATG
jgi:phosphoribosylanthranilate isomerase